MCGVFTSSCLSVYRRLRPHSSQWLRHEQASRGGTQAQAAEPTGTQALSAHRASSGEQLPGQKALVNCQLLTCRIARFLFHWP